MSMTEQSFKPSRSFLAVILIAMLLGLFGSLGVMYYLGTFTDVELNRSVAPPYRIAFLEHVGPYNEIEPTIEKVKRLLDEANVEAGTPCALLLDDASAPAEELRSKVGYLVPEAAYIPGPLQVEKIPSREVITATFDGGALMGSYKAYEAMKEWARAHNYGLSLPAFEIYHPEGAIEYQLPVRKKQ